jgi:uncharacterized membrane protein SirB2
VEYYQLIKTIHITTAVLSLLGFVLRGWWMAKESPLLQHKMVKIFPHVNDTLLLTAAIFLSIMSGLYPFVEGWLGAKVVLLIGYIVAGIFALKRGKSKQARLVAFVIALVCISLIFVSALYRPAI